MRTLLAGNYLVPIKSFILASMLALSASCASVPMASAEQDAASKTFAEPAAGKAGLYVYRRDAFVGQALKKDVFIDGVLIGETASGVFFHRPISPGSHTLSTESEFSANDLEFIAEPRMNYFFEQYIKMGVFVGGANLMAMDEEAGKKGVLECMEALGVLAAEPE
jgi:Protein of unknown function (DUF2846)